jgi:hypothetical protein
MLDKRKERLKAIMAAQPGTPGTQPTSSTAREMPEEDFRNRRFLNFPNGIPIKQLRKQA